MGNVLKYSDLRECCDTCDSKNDKTPVDACVRARAREGDYRYFYNSYSHCFHHSSKLEKYPPITWKKISHRFMKNKLSFSVKQHVIFSKTSRRFQQNNTSFSIKQHVVLWKTSRCFMKNKPLIEKKEAGIAYKKKVERRNRRCFIKGKLQCVFEFRFGGTFMWTPSSSISQCLAFCSFMKQKEMLQKRVLQHLRCL